MLRFERMGTVALELLLLLLVTVALAAQTFQAARLPGVRPNAGDEPLQRELWFRRGRVPRTGPSSSAAGRQSAASLLQRAYQQKRSRAKQTVSSYALSSTSETSGWSPLGPAPLLSDASGPAGDADYGPVSGRVTAIAVDPNDATGNTVYIGAATGGVWKSSNAAAADPAAVTWTPLTDGEATLSTGAIAVQPGNKRVILVGTGEANLALDSYYGLGILRSTDGGAHWNLIPSADNGAHSFAGLGFSKVVFAADRPSLVVAGTSNFTFYPGNGGSGQGLYYSTDSGATWRRAAVNDETTAAMQTSVTDLIYNAAAGKFFAVLAWHGIYSSADAVNWTRLAAQPGGTVLSPTACPAAGASTCPILRGEMAVHPSRNEMYAWYISGDLTYGQFADHGIWKTTDSGNTWTAISTAGIDNCGDFYGCGAAEVGWYALELAALPNGSYTDLYAGAANLFKCTIGSTNPTCSAQPFLNLTHVYGCVPVGSMAHVHANQHAIAYLVAPSGDAVMYFGNDGGVYRALDGYDLRSGACAQAANPFHNLNAALGSLTQLVSLSQHPNDAATLLAGAQGNGSAATDASHSGSNGTTWIAVNGGDGAYTAINPNNASQWFTANTGVTIQTCAKGISCVASDFEPVVSGATLNDDVGPYYTPYVLDPQATGRMLVGTCRVWRGNGDGTGFAALSYNFDTGIDSPCGGTEANLISALATGGPLGAAGSPVIYAGTQSGNIFVTLNAAAGPASWYDATPQQTGYPVSSIALDPADATAKTAYASIMGFGVAHVWKTTNAGLSWTDITGDLPDAPADSVLVDPGNHSVVYLGTDVGVFATENAGGGTVIWEPVGPSSGDNALPNVPVVKLDVFNSGALKILRAATRGRGAWELVLASPGAGYTISVANPVLTLFPNQNGTIAGDLTALYGYNSPVTVSCDAGGGTLPSTCTGQTVTPTRGGTSYSVAVKHGNVADLSFNLKAVGADTSAITHTQQATLHVVDFGLGFAPGSPTSVTVNSGATSSPIELLVSAEGSFNGAVTLSCTSSLPAGANCNFFPSASVSFTSAGSYTVTLTISTLQTTPNTSASPVNISATASGAPGAKTQTISLTIKNEPDYNITAKSTTLRAHPGETVNTRLTLTAVNNYKSTVVASCTAAMPAGTTCDLSASTIYLTNVSKSDFIVTVQVPMTATAGTYAVTISTHDINGTPAHDFLLSLTVVPDFKLTLPQSTTTVSQGGTAVYTLEIAQLGGNFTTPLTFACTGLPPHTSYSFTPAVVTPGSDTTMVTLKVMTSTVLAGVPLRKNNRALWTAMFLPAGIMLAALSDKRRRRRIALSAIIALGVVLLLQACGGGNGGSSQPVTPPADTATPVGTYTLTVTATSADVSHSTTVTLIVQ